MNTVEPTLHRPAPAGQRRGAPERTWWLFMPVIVVLLAGLFSASFVVLPYYTMAPGSAVGLGELVTVEDGPSYPSDGELYLTTVSLRRVTALEALLGWIDPATDVLSEDKVVPPSVDPDDFREFNLAQMDTSKLTAQLVAMRELGFDVPERGTGALIVGVLEGSPADGVVEPGDVIVGIDGQPVALLSEAVAILDTHRPGDDVRLSVRRASVEDDGPVEELHATLAEHPEDASRPLLGVTMQTDNLDYEFPYDVEIGSDRIGGPSAGLAYTLEIIDVLTPGELTGGRKVAATGTIQSDGSVGLVGGVAQKAVAVKRAGVDLFLVPRGEEDNAREHAGDLRVVPVDDIGDALAALDTLGGNALAIGAPEGSTS